MRVRNPRGSWYCIRCNLECMACGVDVPALYEMLGPEGYAPKVTRWNEGMWHGWLCNDCRAAGEYNTKQERDIIADAHAGMPCVLTWRKSE